MSQGGRSICAAAALGAAAAFFIGGCATRQELAAVSERQAQLSLELVRLQDYVAELTIRLQEMAAELREVAGDVAVLGADSEPLEQEVEALRERLARLERRGARTLPQVAVGAPQAATDVMAWADAAQAYAVAVDRLKRGDSRGATAGLLALLQRWPDDEVALRAQLTLAQTYAAADNLLAAIETYLELIESHPQSRFVPKAYLGLGQALLAMQQKEQAGRVLQDLIRLYPEAPESVDAIRLLQADGAATVTQATAPHAVTAPPRASQAMMTAPAAATAPLGLTVPVAP